MDTQTISDAQLKLNTELYVAASKGNAALILELLNKGAQPGGKTDDNSDFMDDYTALMYAIESEKLEAVAALLSHPSMTPEIVNRQTACGTTALMQSITSTQPKIAERLLDFQGIIVTQRNIAKISALEFAIIMDANGTFTEVIQTLSLWHLLQSELNELSPIYNCSPLTLAIRHHKPHLAQILEIARARPAEISTIEPSPEDSSKLKKLERSPKLKRTGPSPNPSPQLKSMTGGNTLAVNAEEEALAKQYNLLWLTPTGEKNKHPNLPLLPPPLTLPAQATSTPIYNAKRSPRGNRHCDLRLNSPRSPQETQSATKVPVKVSAKVN